VDPMTTRDTSLSPDRLARLREHVMTEISTAPAPQALKPTPRGRWTPRRLGTAVAGMAAATAAIVIGLTVATGPGGLGPTAFAVSHLPGDTVAIKVVDTAASAEQMTRQLQAQGVNVRIDAITANPQLVGTWNGAGFTSDVPASIVHSIMEQEHGYVSTIEIPAVFPGTIGLSVGVPTPAGETPGVVGARNALAPGGQLFCERLSGVQPAVAERELAAQGYTVHWADGTHGLYQDEIPDPPPGSRVSSAVIFDFDPQDVSRPIPNPHDVTLTVIDPHDRRYLPQLWLGFAPFQQTIPQSIDYSTCTP
jgi:hypothetical protein